MKKLLYLVAFMALAACQSEKKSLPVIGAEKGVALQAADFSDLKGFEDDSLTEASEAIQKTCSVLISKPNLLQQAAVRPDATSYVRICRRFLEEEPATDEEMRAFLETNFKPYRVLYDLNPEGKFTSYYEAEIRASLTKHGRYVYPIYGRPTDLVEINLQDFDPTLPKRRLVMRVQNQKAVPYLTRSEIEKSGVPAEVVLWGDDPVDIFLMQIQGSAVALLDDGSTIRVRYVDNNGHPFTGIGSILLKKGLLKSGEGSMDKIRDWLKAHPEQAKENMNENRRFIFHGISQAEGPIGAMGVTLTAGRSLAVDPTFIPLGSVLWLETTAPDGRPLDKLVLAQDIGGAIKGAVRGDYFWGHGEEALLSAGKMNAKGQYYILLPRDSEVVIREQ
jgi:membrane-bound lytic murein transglycosylase A